MTTYTISRRYGRTTAVIGTVTTTAAEIGNYLGSLIRKDEQFGACYIATPIKEES